MNGAPQRLGLAALAVLALVTISGAKAAEDGTWKSLRGDVFGEAPIEENSPIVALTAPTRAEDAALVPVEIRATLPAGDTRTIEKITLIVDENPAPVAASFRFGPERRDIALSTRLRVNAYSFVRAVAQTSDGALHMTARYVKATGGCSAPALKDHDQAMARLGELRVKALGPTAAPPAPNVSQAQLMIRHPNYSGLQMDQITRLYVPAKFVNRIEVRQGEDLVFEMEGGISLSEDPAIGFSYPAKGPALAVKAEDTDGRTFSGTLDARASGS